MGEENQVVTSHPNKGTGSVKLTRKNSSLKSPTAIAKALQIPLNLIFWVCEKLQMCQRKDGPRVRVPAWPTGELGSVLSSAIDVPEDLGQAT